MLINIVNHCVREVVNSSDITGSSHKTWYVLRIHVRSYFYYPDDDRSSESTGGT